MQNLDSEDFLENNRLIIAGIPLILMILSLGALLITHASIFFFTTVVIASFFMSIYNLSLFKLGGKGLGIAFIAGGIYFIISAIYASINGVSYISSDLEIILMFICGICTTIMGSSFLLYWYKEKILSKKKRIKVD